MKIHSVIPGSPEWEALRARIRRTASTASVMMGASKKMSRSELVRMVATGAEQEFSEWVRKNLLEKGHEIEAAIRPHIEATVIGDDLYPVAVSDDAEYIMASVDGITEDYRHGWECKSWNEEKAAQVRDDIVPEEDRWQVVQALVITPAEDWTYTVSDGTPEKTVSTVYRLHENDERALMAGWKQFDEDVANYVYVEPTPKAVAGPVLDLPAVSVQVSGNIAIIDNFAAFEVALTDFVANKLIREPQTDQDFADLDAQIKTLKKAEDALQKAEAAVVAQVASIDTMKRTKDMLHKLARDNRLMAEKLLESEKTRRRVEIQEVGKKALADHISALNTRLGRPYMPDIAADFVGVTKGKRTIITMLDAVDTELARAKIAANEIADRIDLNLKALREASSYNFLFHDASQLVLKANDDLQNVIKARIAEHKEAEDKRLEAEQARIRAEEERKAAEKLEQERQRIRQEEETKAKAEHERIAAQKEERVTMGSTAEPIQQPQPAQNIHIPDTASAKVDNGALAAGELIYTARSIAPGRVAVVMGNTEYRMSAEDAERLRSALGAAVLTARAAA